MITPLKAIKDGEGMPNEGIVERDAAGAVIYQTPAAAMEVVGRQVEIVTSNPKMSIGKRSMARKAVA